MTSYTLYDRQAEDKVESLTKELLATKSDLVETEDEKTRLTNEAQMARLCDVGVTT